MDLDFIKAFGSAYIQENDGGRKVLHHTYRVCVELLEACEQGQALSTEAQSDLYHSILQLEKADKRQYLLQRFNRAILSQV